MRRFYWRWIKNAFGGAYGTVSAISTALGVAVAAIADKHPLWLGVDTVKLISSFGGWIFPLCLFSSLAVSRLVLAPYWIYRESDTKARETENELHIEREKSQPCLLGDIEMHAYYNLVGTLTNGKSIHLCPLFFMISIRNTGAPSVVEKWRLSLTIPGQSPVIIAPHRIPEIRSLLMQAGATGVNLQDEEEICEKTVTPLVSGGLVRGWIVFMCPTESLPETTNAELFFADVRGKQYSTSVELKNTQGSNASMFLPGTNQPFAGVKWAPKSSTNNAQIGNPNIDSPSD